MPQIKKPDDLQLIANLIRFFSYERRLLSTMEITQNNLAVILTVSLAADLSDAALGKSSAVYGHIDENGFFVRKRTARKKAITDKMVKNGSLSVNLTVRSWLRLVEQHRLFGKGSFFTRKKPACQRTRGRELKSKQ